MHLALAPHRVDILLLLFWNTLFSPQSNRKANYLSVLSGVVQVSRVLSTADDELCGWQKCWCETGTVYVVLFFFYRTDNCTADVLWSFHIQCRAIFIGFALLRSVIGSENSRLFLNQLDTKLKPIRTWSPALSRALFSFVVLVTLALRGVFLSPDWRMWFLWFWLHGTQSKSF